jgi:PAS domain-containing protein
MHIRGMAFPLNPFPSIERPFSPGSPWRGLLFAVGTLGDRQTESAVVKSSLTEGLVEETVRGSMNPSLFFRSRGTSRESSEPFGQDQQQRGEPRHRVLRTSDAIGIYFCDATGLITYFSNEAAELWGRQPTLGNADERFCGSLRLYRRDGSYLPDDQSPMSYVLAGKLSGVYDAKVHIERPDGSRIVAIVNIAPLIDDNGTIAGAFCSFRGNSRRKRSQDTYSDFESPSFAH